MCSGKMGRGGTEPRCLYCDDMLQKIFVDLDKLGPDGQNIVTPSAPDGAKNVLRENRKRRR